MVTVFVNTRPGVFAPVEVDPTSGGVTSVGAQTGDITLDGGDLSSTVLAVPRYDAAQSLSDAQKNQVRSNLGLHALGGTACGFKNVLINPEGQYNQRAVGSGAATDDTYAHDRHYVLTQSAGITPSTLTDVADGYPYMMRISQANASAQRMGVAQIVESAVGKHFRGKKATLSGTLRFSTAAAVRYAILSWTGTADSVTSDVVNDWTSSTYTAGNFFLASNLTVEAVGTITPSANTLTSFSVTTTGNVSSSMNNLIVFIWTEGTAAQNVTLDFRWQLEVGSAATEFERRPFEQQLCWRYCRKWLFSTSATIAQFSVYIGGTESYGKAIELSVPMFTTPTVSVSSVGHFAISASSNQFCSSMPFAGSTPEMIGGSVFSSAAHGSAGQCSVLSAASSSAWIMAVAEL